MRLRQRASTTSRLSALRAAGELASCSDRTLESLLPHMDEVSLPPGYRIAAEGRPCTEFVIVADGRLRAQSRDGGCRLLGAGDSIGWEAMWDRGSNQATVIADTHARLLVMGHGQFRAAKAVALPPVDGRAVREPRAA